MSQQNDNSEHDPARAVENAQLNFDRMIQGIPKDIQEREAKVADRLYASGDVTLNRAWIPPLYLTWD